MGNITVIAVNKHQQAKSKKQKATSNYLRKIYKPLFTVTSHLSPVTCHLSPVTIFEYLVMTNPAATADNLDWQDALEDVHTRFILNLPPTELETADRIFFQVEQAWWFYEDFICDANPDKKLPRFANLKPFALKLFEFSPLLPDAGTFPAMWTEFSKYKRKISNYGCILLNEDCTKVVLCQVWNGKSHTFPSGKINQGEHGAEAAARETYEETGFDPNCLFGHAATLKQRGMCTWKSPLREKDALVFQEQDGKRRTNYVCRGVPEDFPFAPVARKEVSRIAWYPLDQLPKPNFAVQPFLTQLHRWIKRNNKGNKNARSTPGRGDGSQGRQTPNRRDGSRSRRTPNRSRQNSRQRVRGNDSDLVQAGLAQEGDISGWSEEDMFATNERLMGRKVTYDGNPHVFEKGFGGQDPHAFHVVGDGFMNSVVQSLAPPPETSKLQPLFRKGDAGEEDDDDDLQPFFSEEGTTLWGEVGQDVPKDTETAVPPFQSPRTIPGAGSVTTNPAGSSILAMLQSATTNNIESQTTTTKPTSISREDGGMESIFMTDAEITARSQAQKTAAVAAHRQQKAEARRVQYEADLAFVMDWVANLPKPPVTKHFGEFRLDADAIVEGALRMARQPTGIEVCEKL